MPTRGVIYVHSSPPAVCPHVEWAIGRALDTEAKLTWSVQPASPPSWRTDCAWNGPPGTAMKLAKALQKWQMLRFEITEDASPGVDGERIMFVPSRGLYRTATSANGDLLIDENRIRALLATTTDADTLRHGLNKLLGTEWDAELNVYRNYDDDAGQNWLSQVS
ncbi:MAG TPA: DUF3145 domain-containing protein [Candidatus Stackebrandtia excrementipullorum]|nr:DUF3145 domain-containing protein [Candidatus Stackebrandtia excrementipullorum]